MTVSDLAASIAFYEEMFGASVAMRVEHGGELSLALLELPDAFLELLEYRPAGRNDRRPLASDLGAGHFALLMDDVVDAHARLLARGVVFEGPPERIAAGPSRGYVITFCLDPDGNRVELIQPPR